MNIATLATGWVLLSTEIFLLYSIASNLEGVITFAVP
jgi:hypothetical protein